MLYIALNSSLKPHASRYREAKYRGHSLPSLWYFRLWKRVHAEHLFAQFAHLLDHDLLHLTLQRVSNPTHFGGEEEFFQCHKQDPYYQKPTKKVLRYLKVYGIHNTGGLPWDSFFSP